VASAAQSCVVSGAAADDLVRARAFDDTFVRGAGHEAADGDVATPCFIARQAARFHPASRGAFPLLGLASRFAVSTSESAGFEPATHGL